ncbi:MAG: hypothetical protein IPM56_16390 [Ignavibacteriales bacterium]|nr:MAG: hypothetical protein IPM56_16390 [Ignavibacteriales bacterium]
MPLSFTIISAISLLKIFALTSILLPSFEYLIPFESRFVITIERCRSSP